MSQKKKLCIKKHDLVKVIAGDQKGLIGRILYIDYSKSRAVLDSGKYRKKAAKNKEAKEEEEDILIPLAIHTSNLMHWNQDLKIASRVGYKYKNEEKLRYFKKSPDSLIQSISLASQKNNNE